MGREDLHINTSKFQQQYSNNYRGICHALVFFVMSQGGASVRSQRQTSQVSLVPQKNLSAPVPPSRSSPLHRVTTSGCLSCDGLQPGDAEEICPNLKIARQAAGITTARSRCCGGGGVSGWQDKRHPFLLGAFNHVVIINATLHWPNKYLCQGACCCTSSSPVPTDVITRLL